MTTSINTTIKLQAAAFTLALVLTAWPGSGSAGIMGTGVTDDSEDTSTLSTEEESSTCLWEAFGFSCDGSTEEVSSEDDDVTTDGIMGTG